MHVLKIFNKSNFGRYLTVFILLYALDTVGARPEEELLQEQQQQLPNNNNNNNNHNNNAIATLNEQSNMTDPKHKDDTPPEFCFTMEENLCANFNHESSSSDADAGQSATPSPPPPSTSCQCRSHKSPNSTSNNWYCCNITNMQMITTCPNTSHWTSLHIYNMTMPQVDISSSLFQTLNSLAITDGNITKLIFLLSRVAKIKCLNISNNNLANITLRASRSLKFLNISNNNLSSLPQFNQNQNITLDIRYNKRMLCKVLAEAIFRGSIKFVSPNSSFCVLKSAYNWFNSDDYVAISQLDLIRRIYTECPVIPGKGNCTCESEHMLTTGENNKKIIGYVNCSSLGLTELPPKLPQNTFLLNIENNSITTLGDHFHNNPTYRSIMHLNADNNHIESIHDLEGTKFMDHFQKLYLRNNYLKRLPEYLLTNVLDASSVGRVIFLAGNKLVCDCNSAKVLKIWLISRSRDIPDYNEILCRNLPTRVMELQEIKVCQSPHDWTDYVYYLIATEVILLIALITKVSYDYWVFKTAGYLPWPASKMPKLPCDWLCES